MQTISNSIKWHSKKAVAFVGNIFNCERILIRISQQWRGQSKETKNRHATPPPQHIRFNPLTHPLYSTTIRIPRPLQTCITRHRHIFLTWVPMFIAGVSSCQELVTFLLRTTRILYAQISGGLEVWRLTKTNKQLVTSISGWYCAYSSEGAY